MNTHIVSRIAESDQKHYLNAPIYLCGKCGWTGNVIESCEHLATNQIEIIAPPKIRRSTIN